MHQAQHGLTEGTRLSKKKFGGKLFICGAGNRDIERARRLREGAIIMLFMLCHFLLSLALL